MKPRLFIGSSKESLYIANAIQQNLYKNAEVTVWNQGIFVLTSSSLDSLIKAQETEDFAVFVFSPDDIVSINGTENQAVRDNVIFELGLFIGGLGKDRCFIFVPEGDKPRIPTDLLGITYAPYETNRTDDNYQAATAPACTTVRERISQVGPREFESESAAVSPDGDEDSTLDITKDHTESKKDNKDDVMELPKWAIAFWQDNYPEALDLILKQIEADTDPDAKLGKQIVAAMLSFRIDHRLGRERYEELLNQNPTNASIYNSFALELMRKNQHPACIELLDKGLSTVTKKTILILSKSDCLNQMGQSKDAINILQESLSEYDDNPLVYSKLADIYIELEQITEAKSCLEKGLNENPDNKELLSSYANLLYKHFDKKLSLIPYNTLIELEPDSSNFHALRGNTFLDLGFNDLAMNDYRIAKTASEGKQSWILANIGNLLTSRGLFSDGIEYLRKSLELSPEDQYSLDRLAGSIKQRDEELEKLRSIIKEARVELLSTTFDPGSAEPHTQN